MEPCDLPACYPLVSFKYSISVCQFDQRENAPPNHNSQLVTLPDTLKGVVVVCCFADLLYVVQVIEIRETEGMPRSSCGLADRVLYLMSCRPRQYAAAQDHQSCVAWLAHLRQGNPSRRPAKYVNIADVGSVC